jgi:hypothetical protein
MHIWSHTQWEAEQNCISLGRGPQEVGEGKKMLENGQYQNSII